MCVCTHTHAGCVLGCARVGSVCVCIGCVCVRACVYRCGITGGHEFCPVSSMLNRQTFLNMMMVQSSDHQGCATLQRGFYLFLTI